MPCCYCLHRPWSGARVGLPISVEALTGSSYPVSLGRRFLRASSPERKPPPQARFSWLAHESPLRSMFERCRWRLSHSANEPQNLPPMNIEFEVLGHSLAPVPTHFFKVVLGVNPRDLEENKRNDMPPSIGHVPVASKKAAWPQGTPPPSVFGAFVVPNKAMHHNLRAESFRVPLSFIELVTGIDFGVSHPRTRSQLCTVVNPSDKRRLRCALDLMETQV